MQKWRDSKAINDSPATAAMPMKGREDSKKTFYLAELPL